ncbi:hypothetical protein ACFL6C_09365 [Myxococcota bacterium]
MRIAIVGLGAVGEACAHALTASEVARSLVLLNRTENVAPAIAADLRQARAWGRPLDTEVGSLDDWTLLQGCDLLLLTMGARLRGDQDRSAIAVSTASLIRGNEECPGFLQGLKQLRESQDEDSVPIVLVISNPVEATVTWLLEQTEWPRHRMFGLGTTVESARFSGFLAQELDVDAGSVWVDVVGEHGKRFVPLDVSRLQAMFPKDKIEMALDLAKQETLGAAQTIRAFSEELGKRRAASVVEAIRQGLDGRLSGGDLDAVADWLADDLQWRLAPPATRYAIAASANVVVRAVREDLNQVLTVSALPPPGLFEPQVALALPFVVGRAGLGDCLIQKMPAVGQEAAEAISAQVSSMRDAE